MVVLLHEIGCAIFTVELDKAARPEVVPPVLRFAFPLPASPLRARHQAAWNAAGDHISLGSKVAAEAIKIVNGPAPFAARRTSVSLIISAVPDTNPRPRQLRPTLSSRFLREILA